MKTYLVVLWEYNSRNGVDIILHKFFFDKKKARKRFNGVCKGIKEDLQNNVKYTKGTNYLNYSGKDDELGKIIGGSVLIEAPI